MLQRKQLEQQLIEKTMKDPEFRKRLLDNPKSVIEEETGVELPLSVNFKILTEDPQTVYLVLPFIPAQPDQPELTEAELEMIAGGTLGETTYVCTISGCVPPGDPE